MITGVGNDQFTWMYAMGFGVPRAPGSIHAFIPDGSPCARMDSRRFFVDSVFFSCNFYSPASFVMLESSSPCSFPQIDDFLGRGGIRTWL